MRGSLPLRYPGMSTNAPSPEDQALIDEIRTEASVLRAETAKLVTDAGFTSIAVIAGGMDAYLAASPLTDKDKKARIAAVVQPDAGVKYGYGSDRNSDTA